MVWDYNSGNQPPLLEAGDTLLILAFKAKDYGLTSEVLDINGSITKALLYDDQNLEHPLSLSVPNTSQLESPVVLMQNEPNP